MSTVSALEVRILQGAGRPEVQRFASTLTGLRLALQDIDRLSLTERTVRPTWVIDHMAHEDRLFTVRLTAADSQRRDRDSLMRPVTALVDGVHLLRESPTLPDYYSEATVDRLVGVALPRDGIDRVSLASVNGHVGPIEDLDDIVLQHARQAVQGSEVAIGSVTGLVHAIRKVKSGVRATIYDPVRHRAVSCSAPVSMEGQLRDAWPHRVVARGRITRNAIGQPIRVSLSNLELLPEDDSQRPAASALLGALPGMTGGAGTDAFIREARRG